MSTLFYKVIIRLTCPDDCLMVSRICLAYNLIGIRVILGSVVAPFKIHLTLGNISPFPQFLHYFMIGYSELKLLQ